MICLHEVRGGCIKLKDLSVIFHRPATLNIRSFSASISSFRVNFLAYYLNKQALRYAMFCFAGNKQKWVPLDIEPPKVNRPGRKSKSPTGERIRRKPERERMSKPERIGDKENSKNEKNISGKENEHGN